MRKGRAALVGALTLGAYQAVSARGCSAGRDKEERRMPRGSPAQPIQAQQQGQVDPDCDQQRQVTQAT